MCSRERLPSSMEELKRIGQTKADMLTNMVARTFAVVGATMTAMVGANIAARCYVGVGQDDFAKYLDQTISNELFTGDSSDLEDDSDCEDTGGGLNSTFNAQCLRKQCDINCQFENKTRGGYIKSIKKQLSIVTFDGPTINYTIDAGEDSTTRPLRGRTDEHHDDTRQQRRRYRSPTRITIAIPHDCNVDAYATTTTQATNTT